MSAQAHQLAGADLVPGTVVAERRVAFDETSFRRFAELTGDAHPVHYDEAYARAQGLRAPLVHGLLLVAMTALGATELSARLHAAMIAMLGTSARFIAPAYRGDVLTLRTQVSAVQPKSRNRCVASFNVDLLGADGSAVASVQHQFLLRHSLEGAPA